MKAHQTHEIDNAQPGASAIPPLPDLHDAILDRATVEQLFRDIELCTGIVEVIPKFGAQSYVPESSSFTLEELRELLLSQKLRGLQIRYQYDGSTWWDTILVVPRGYRIVRIQHDFAR